MSSKNYEFYTASDFAKDEDFQNWVLHPDLKNTSFWEAWIQEHPERREEIDTAILLVRSVQFRSYYLNESEKNKIWDNIWDKVPVEDTNDIQVTGWKKRSKNNFWKYVAAAVVVGLIAVAVTYQWNSKTSGETIAFSNRTGAAEYKKITFPDSSEVILNANSQLDYSEVSNIREVWLKGEAFFNVKHTRDNKPFIVHTDDNLSVRVLGTRFNVNTFGAKISVVLQQGSIQLGIPGNAPEEETKLYLRPNEMVTYNKKVKDFSKRKIEADRFISWTSGRLTMDHYALTDMQRFVRDVFDKNVIIKDSSLLKERISGSMPIEYDLNTMLLQFEKAFQVHIKQHGNEIWVEK